MSIISSIISNIRNSISRQIRNVPIMYLAIFHHSNAIFLCRLDQTLAKPIDSASPDEHTDWSPIYLLQGLHTMVFPTTKGKAMSEVTTMTKIKTGLTKRNAPTSITRVVPDPPVRAPGLASNILLWPGPSCYRRKRRCVAPARGTSSSRLLDFPLASGGRTGTCPETFILPGSERNMGGSVSQQCQRLVPCKV